MCSGWPGRASSGSASPSGSTTRRSRRRSSTRREEEGLPLLEVPRRTPFLAISKAVSAAIAADQYRAVTAGFAAQRELTKQALTDGPEGLLAALAAQVDGWAALYDASGAVVATAPEWAGRRAARLTADVERLRERPAPARRRVVGGRRRGPRRAALPRAPGGGRGPRSPWARPPRWARPSGTPCTRRSPC